MEVKADCERSADISDWGQTCAERINHVKGDRRGHCEWTILSTPFPVGGLFLRTDLEQVGETQLRKGRTEAFWASHDAVSHHTDGCHNQTGNYPAPIRWTLEGQKLAFKTGRRGHSLCSHGILKWRVAMDAFRRVFTWSISWDCLRFGNMLETAGRIVRVIESGRNRMARWHDVCTERPAGDFSTNRVQGLARWPSLTYITHCGDVVYQRQDAMPMQSRRGRHMTNCQKHGLSLNDVNVAFKKSLLCELAVLYLNHQMAHPKRLQTFSGSLETVADVSFNLNVMSSTCSTADSVEFPPFRTLVSGRFF